jgi:type VI secretion system secreted protein Hcp
VPNAVRAHSELAAVPAQGPLQYFLKIDKIAGESVDAKHPGEIEVLSFSWGARQPAHVSGAAAPGVGTSGRSTPQDFHITMKMNKASPALLQSSASGQRLNEAILTAQATGKGQQEDFLKLKFTELIVSSYETDAAPGERPVDAVSFNFGAVQIDYSSQKPDGTLDQPVHAGWDWLTNQSV